MNSLHPIRMLLLLRATNLPAVLWAGDPAAKAVPVPREPLLAARGKVRARREARVDLAVVPVVHRVDKPAQVGQAPLLRAAPMVRVGKVDRAA